MFSALYNVIVAPLVLLLEFFYELIYEITNNQGLAVIGLSFAVTLLTLPLYMIAEHWQEVERQTQERFKPYVERIKAVFKGDEQYMILNTFYKQNHYHPMMALRSSISLLIQVPFFIAAYNFLSNLETLRGYSFLFIKNFGSPDAFLKIGNFNVNILPILMTVINCVAGAIYSKGHDVKEKIQIYGLALVFLFVLYDSPAGLVVYWTMNNILSLVKNIFYKIKNPKKVLYIILCVFCAVCLLSPFTILSDAETVIKAGLIFIAVVLPFIPFILVKLTEIIDEHFYIKDEDDLSLNLTFVFSSLVLVVLTGFVIPSMLVDSEPFNYCYVNDIKSPFYFINTTLFKATGFFLAWPISFFVLFSKKIKKPFTIIFSILALISLLNTFAFSGKYGPIEPTLLFMETQSFMPSLKIMLVNILSIILISVACIVLLKKFPKVLQSFFAIILFSLVAISVKNSVSIHSSYVKMEEPVVQEELSPIFKLSKNEKNVIVMMLDKCYSPFIPYIFEDKEELKNQFDGFVYYPNTVSMGPRTMVGISGIFGGYEYTPYEINKRTNETIQKKYNESLLSMPVLFGNNDYRVQVTGFPYENFLEYPITKMYEPYPFIERIETVGNYSDYWYKHNDFKKTNMVVNRINRNFICFSLFKIMPPMLRNLVYHNEYWTCYKNYDKVDNFINFYSVVDYLSELTSVDEDKGSFIIFDNEVIHEAIALQAPDFIPANEITEKGNKTFENDVMYSTMSGVLRRLTDFFDYLKENDCYDNTRIIIVSDHGKGDNSVASEKVNCYEGVGCSYVATLMVKDFNSSGEMKTDMSFMTNADTPVIATKDLIKNAKNPFTGNTFEVENKADYVKMYNGEAQSTKIRDKFVYGTGEEKWYTVKDNIFEKENWGKLEK